MMIKINGKCILIFKTALLINLLTLSSISFSNETTQEKLIARLTDALKTSSQFEDNHWAIIQKSKQDTESIFGSWYLLYSSGSITYTAKVILEEYRLSADGSDMVRGRFYRDENSAEREIYCIEDDFDFGRGYDTNYWCMTSDKRTPYRVLSLQFLENTVKGILSLGETLDEASAGLNFSNNHVSGYSASGLPFFFTTYDDDNDEIHIPVLNYKGAKYKLVLKHIGDLQFTIQSIEGSSGVGEGEVGLDATYDDNNGELLIPMVEYKDARYSAVLTNIGDFVFTLKNIYPNKKVHSGQADFYIDPYLLDPNINPITGGFVWDPVTLYPVRW